MGKEGVDEDILCRSLSSAKENNQDKRDASDRYGVPPDGILVILRGGIGEEDEDEDITDFYLYNRPEVWLHTMEVHGDS